MKSAALSFLLVLLPCGALGISCNADNVLRALRSKSADATAFCSTYTLPPPNQPLPTYVSQYPASRVSSACTCLATTATTLSTSTSTSASSTTVTSQTASPTPDACVGELITNGGFGGYPSYSYAPWVLGPSSDYAVAEIDFQSGNQYAFFAIYNKAPLTSGSAYIKQDVPSLCHGREYQVKYGSSALNVNQGAPRDACNLRISLADTDLFFATSRNYTSGPYDYNPHFFNFFYPGNKAGGNTLTITVACIGKDVVGNFKIDDISLVGVPPRV